MSKLPTNTTFFIDYQYFTNPPDINIEYHRLLTKIIDCLIRGFTQAEYPLESCIINLEEFVRKHK